MNEIDGTDEVICPVDSITNGYISDDWIFHNFVQFSVRSLSTNRLKIIKKAAMIWMLWTNIKDISLQKSL